MNPAESSVVEEENKDLSETNFAIEDISVINEVLALKNSVETSTMNPEVEPGSDGRCALTDGRSGESGEDFVLDVAVAGQNLSGYSSSQETNKRKRMKVSAGASRADKGYLCEHCGKQFSTDEGLKKHKHVHSGKQSFQCLRCLKSFTKSSDLRRHERIHTGERPFKCEICTKTFTTSGHLREHVRIHTGEKPFKCDICEKTFTKSGNLREHERIHTGERPFKCEICFKSFTTSGNLREHERMHTGERPFECEICRKTLTRSGSLRKHERMHSCAAAHSINSTVDPHC